MKKVLIIEDEDGIIRRYRAILEGKVTLIIAKTVEDAERLFMENADADIIVVDGCLSETFDTGDLVKHIRSTGYSGTMIANSSMYNEKLLQAGCNIRCDRGDKKAVGEQVLQLLSIVVCPLGEATVTQV